ncbi:MAG: hypothetical protein ACRD0W_18100 [Acidimicrobiales bacterium]
MTAVTDRQVLPARDVSAPNAPAVTGSQLMARFPPRPLASSWPATRARRSAVLARVLAPPFALPNKGSQQTRRLGVLAVLNWLQIQPGDTWQDRWQASGAETHPDWQVLVGAARAQADPSRRLPHLAPGLLVLICADVIRPALRWLLGCAPARRGLAVEMGRTRDSAAFTELTSRCATAAVGLQAGQQALARIAVIMAAKGGVVADISVGDCVELLDVARTHGRGDAHTHSPLFYQLLRTHSRLGADAPASFQMFTGRGRPSCEQLIDRYRIQCRPVRDLLVDYLREREPSVDFSSLQRFAYLLGKLFWATWRPITQVSTRSSCPATSRPRGNSG